MLNPEASDLSPPVRPAATIAASAEACPFLNPRSMTRGKAMTGVFPGQQTLLAYSIRL